MACHFRTHFIKKVRKNSLFFEEFHEADLEQECVEEVCDFNELEEVSDDYEIAKGHWAGYVVCGRNFQIKTQRFRECVFNVVHPAIEESSATTKPSATTKATTTTTPTTKPTVAGRAPTVAGQSSKAATTTETSFMTETPFMTSTSIPVATMKLPTDVTIDTTDDSVRFDTTSSVDDFGDKNFNSRESFTDVVTRGNIGWVMTKQQNAYELGSPHTKNFLSERFEPMNTLMKSILFQLVLIHSKLG